MTAVGHLVVTAPRIANSVNDGVRERKSLPDIDERSGRAGVEVSI